VPPSPTTPRWHRSRRTTTATFTLLAALVAAVPAVSSIEMATAPAASAAGWGPVHAGDFPDPSVLQWNGSYYAFATQNFAAASQTINIQESTSPDGVHWTQSNADALPQLPSWAEVGNTWSPSVAYDATANHFVMYYTATQASTGDQCIGVATAPATSPLGPYTDSSSAPAVCQNGIDVGDTVDNGNYGGSIDPDIFTDPSSGQSWLLWKSDGNHIALGQTSIWSVPLTSSLLPVAGANPILLLDDDQSWQGGVIEGPDMYFRPATGGGGTYYLFYSGGMFGTSTYGIGWATCSGPSGPCSDRTTSNPLLTTAAGMSGPGGPDVYTLPSGQPVTAFAAWQGSTIGYLSCGIRPMYLADLTFDTGNAPSTPSLTPDPGGGTSPAANPTCPGPPPPPPGYWQVASDGGVFTFGAAGFYGSTGSMRLNKPVVGLAPTPDHRGYWLVASDGGVFAFGDAGFYGSTGSIVLNKPVIGMIATLDGHGYWLIASDGGVFAYGDATFYGSAGSDNLAYPVTAAAPSFLGGGYWMADANGQVLPYGNAVFEGQPAFAPGGYRITGMTGTRSSNGYWLASANGNVAGFGDAAPYGSMYGQALNGPVVGITATPDGAGYWLQGSDGGIFTFGDAPFLGSMGGLPLNAPMVGIAST